MDIKKIVRNVTKKVVYGYRSTSNDYIQYLKKGGADIGKGTYIYEPHTVRIDSGRPYLLSIGSYVIICADVIILTHDYSHSVVRKTYGVNIGDATSVHLGNNCFVGMRSIILMGADIGDNCIIGAGSVVTSGKYPKNSVIAGNPARVVCSLQEYKDRKERKSVEQAKTVVNIFWDKFQRFPTLDEMGDAYAWLYLPRNKENIKNYRKFFELDGDDYNDVVKCFMSSKAKFENYKSFLKTVENYKN